MATQDWSIGCHVSWDVCWMQILLASILQTFILVWIGMYLRQIIGIRILRPSV